MSKEIEENGTLIPLKLKLYAVRSQDGKWMRTRGYGGGGRSWVDDITDAKLYGKPGPARARITWWAKHHPQYGVPELVVLHVTAGTVVDETDRVEHKKQKEKEQKARQAVRRQQQRIKDAEAEFQRAQAKLNMLKGK